MVNDWENAERHAERAFHFCEAGQWDKALSEFRRALRVQPDQSEWRYAMGLTLDHMNRFAEAADCFAHVVKLRGEEPETMLRQVISQVRGDRPRDALKVLRRIHQIDATFEPAYCFEILAHAQLGEHEQAEQAFYLGRQWVDECATCYDHMAQSLAATGQYDRANFCWQRVLAMEPQYPSVHANLARIAWAQGDVVAARRHFTKQLRASPGDVDTLMDLGNLLMMTNQLGEAGEKFRRALEMDPSLGEAELHLGELALMTDHLDAAERSLENARRLCSDLPLVHLRLAQVARRRGELDDACQLVRLELQTQHDHPDHALDLADELIELKMYESAAEVVTPVIDSSQGPPTVPHEQLGAAYLLRGLSRISLGRTSAGAADCRQAVRLVPDNAPAMHSLVLANLSLGRLAWARYWLRRLIAIKGRDTKFRRLRLRLLRGAVRARFRRWRQALQRCLRFRSAESSHV